MKKRSKEEVVAYRTCFSTDAGKRVLGHLLLQAGLFDDDLKTPEDLAVENFAKRILTNLGINDTPDKMREYVNKLFEIKIS